MSSGVCYHHPSQPAVAFCNDCGKGLCRDCYDSYGAGMGAGKALCFDCTQEMVKEHVEDIAKFKKGLIRDLVLMGVGFLLFGSIFGFGMGEVGQFILCGLIGGSALTLLFSGWLFSLGWVSFVFGLLAGPFITIYRLIKKIRQIGQANRIIESDAQILQEMRDYFEYTLVMERSAGVDLSTLASQGSELYDNSYAQTVLQKGEKVAQTELRKGAVQIAANGEIIRSFDPVKKNKRKAA